MKTAFVCLLLLVSVRVPGQQKAAKPDETYGTLEVLASKVDAMPITRSPSVTTNCQDYGSQIDCQSTASGPSVVIQDELSLAGVFSSPNHPQMFIVLKPILSVGETFAQGMAQGGGASHIAAGGVRLQPGKYEAVIKKEQILTVTYHHLDKHGRDKIRRAKYAIQSMTLLPDEK